MVDTARRAIKGRATKVFSKQTLAALSDTPLDFSFYNAASVEVRVAGTNPSADISLEGAFAAGGFSIPLSDPQASQLAVTSDKIFDCAVGTLWAKVRLTNVTGTFGSGQGFTVIATPYVSPGLSKMKAVS